ncbi:MAG: lambda-exonuclease family protein [Tagaea sp.]
MIERKCPHCATRLRLPAARQGVVACPACGTRFLADTRTASDPVDEAPPRGTERPDVRQGSREWLAVRQDLAMASETPAVLGVSPYQSPAKLRAAKRGEAGFVSAAMRKGTEEEPRARAAYVKAWRKMHPAFLVSGRFGCSLDGLSDCGGEILEIKTPYRGRAHERWALAAEGRTTAYDAAQIQHQLMVSRARVAYLWVWDAQSREGLRVEVLPDPEFWSDIRAAWRAFWPSLGRAAE